jgi:2-polyprenyl-3-methyl-5-hydroxy-6-metoxy-1,4-benzoquinol methylase
MNKKQFLQFCTQLGIPEGETLYSKINGNPTAVVAELHRQWPAAFTPIIETQAKGKTA